MSEGAVFTFCSYSRFIMFVVENVDDSLNFDWVYGCYLHLYDFAWNKSQSINFGVVDVEIVKAAVIIFEEAALCAHDW